jgi:hypothetical protein
MKGDEWKRVRGLWSYGAAIRMQGDKWKATAPFYLGEMNFPCVLGCGAIHFYKESLARKCCDDGHGQFEGLAPLPNFLLNLLSNQGFHGCVRSYNNTFAMATLGVTTGSNIVCASDYPYYVKLVGSIYHSLPPLLPQTGAHPQFSQVYIMETAQLQLEA